jgi:hypothetical protein
MFALMLALVLAWPHAAKSAQRPVDPAEGQVLVRAAATEAPRWRLLLVPGSGCQSLQPSFSRLVGGAPGAQVFLLQKPHLSGSECSLDFLQEDRLGVWRERALALARGALAGSDATLPLVLAGLSEGAELLPALAQAFPQASLLLMVGNAGLDPYTTGRLQARRLGVEQRWQAIFDAVDAGGSASRMIEGRDWRYWRDLRHWPLEQALLADPRPLLQVWGGQDDLVPQEAYRRFQARATQRQGGYCGLRFGAADHELREGGSDRLQAVWRGLELMLREPQGWRADCARLQRAAAD